MSKKQADDFSEPATRPQMDSEKAGCDPWKHRHASMKCVSCMWYVSKMGKHDIGRCRRHAPSMNGYPAVFPSDWCGDHKIDENK